MKSIGVQVFGDDCLITTSVKDENPFREEIIFKEGFLRYELDPFGSIKLVKL